MKYYKPIKQINNMKWEKVSGSLPGEFKQVHLMINGEASAGHRKGKMFKTINGGQYSIDEYDIEWLDYSDESPSSDPAEVLVKALKYFASEKHLFDAATRKIATEALEQHEQLKQQ